MKNLSEKELIIYNYVLKHKVQIPYMSVRDLAQATFTSNATVLRFVKKLGYDSYLEFKYEIKKELSKPTTGGKNDRKEIFHCLQQLNTEYYNQKLSKVSNILKKQHQLLFLGIGNSSYVADYGARIFMTRNHHAFKIQDPYARINNVQLPVALIVLSVSGNTDEVIESVEHWKSLGVTVIAITSNSDNRLSRISDYILPYYLNEQRINDIDFTSQIPPMFILEELAERVS